MDVTGDLMILRCLACAAVLALTAWPRIGSAEPGPRVVLVDSRADDDGWERINPALLAVVGQIDMPLQALEIGSGASPLEAALQDSPPLVVLGSWREFSEQECLAVERYVRAGGKLLAAAHATEAKQARLVNLNTLLGPLGCTVRLGRPQGALKASPLLGEVPPVGVVPAGLAVRGGAIPLGDVDGGVAAAALTCGRGTLLVADAGPLAASPEYQRFLGACLRWLMQQTHDGNDLSAP